MAHTQKMTPHFGSMSENANVLTRADLARALGRHPYALTKDELCVASEDDIFLSQQKQLPDNVTLSGNNIVMNDLERLQSSIIIKASGSLTLPALLHIAPGQSLTAEHNVSLPVLTELPANVSLRAGHNVDIRFVERIAPGVAILAGNDIDLRSLKNMPAGTVLAPGGDLWMSSIRELPSGVTLTPGGDLYLNSLVKFPRDIKISCNRLFINDQIEINGFDIRVKSQYQILGPSLYSPRTDVPDIVRPYVERNRMDVTQSSGDHASTVILYKRVSSQWKTQAGQTNETTWTVGTELVVPRWDPTNECGPGKFHACARPHWCDPYCSGDGIDYRYIAIRVRVDDLYETDVEKCMYPSKIAFRRGYVVGEVDRNGRPLRSTAAM